MVSLTLAKQYLDVLHSADDAKLQLLLDAAHDSAREFLGVAAFSDLYNSDAVPVSSSEVLLPPAVQLGVLIYLQAAYQASPQDAEQLILVAERTLMPYRQGWGV